MRHGFVYIMSNVCMPDIYKVGFTRGSPAKRAAELSAETSAPAPFEVVCYAEYDDAQRQEAEIHHKLDQFRVTGRREFFRGPLARIVDLVLDRDRAISMCEMDVEARLYFERKVPLKLVGGFA